MKNQLNCNYFTAKLIVKNLLQAGVTDVCISPGSRNTPLTIAFSEEKKLKKHIIIDERISAFYALGISMKSGKPTAIVTTSGTATAEIYPAIIEAFNSRIPLIALTADRPYKLYNTGANQTINQLNIFSNNIRAYLNVGNISEKFSFLSSLNKKLKRKLEVGLFKNRGPIHINVPFEKPLEPEENLKLFAKESIELLSDRKAITINKEATHGKFNLKSLQKLIADKKRILIILSATAITKSGIKSLIQYSNKFNIPVIVEPTSPLRFSKVKSDNLVFYASSFLRNLNLFKQLEPELIIQFGKPPVSSALLNFLKNSKSLKILVNEFGDVYDPSRSYHKIIKALPEKLIEFLIKNKISPLEIDKVWLNSIYEAERITSKFYKSKLSKIKFPFEGKIVSSLVDLIPPNSNLFVSNSLPIRNLDFYANSSSKKINVFSNRGASGIDGIISTAAGMAKYSKNNFLIIGDLAFLHDFSSLIQFRKSGIQLTIILINNSGGRIFEMLPIAKSNVEFYKYWITPHKSNFKQMVNGLNLNYEMITSWKQFESAITNSEKVNDVVVYEFKTHRINSTELRQNLWTELNELISAKA